jgi:putative ABC transport system permease protein
MQPYLTPVKHYYFQSNNGVARKMIYTLIGIALFILLMAIINFINISVGSSVTRLKEIGIRKVMGGLRRQLVLQFLTESVLLTAISVTVSLLLYHVLRPLAGEITGKPIPAFSSFPVWFTILPFVIILVTGLLAGIYPAFVLSAQPSVQSIKGKLKSIQEKLYFRRGLIAVQFITAIIVFAGSIIITKQVTYYFNKDLGYNKEHIITAAVPRDWTVTGVRRMETIRNEFKALAEVEEATFAWEIQDGASAADNNIIFKAAEDSSKGISALSIFSDEKYAAAYGIPLTAGEFLPNPSNPADFVKLVINEKAAKGLGWKIPAEAIGQKVFIQGDTAQYTITGVTKDFHFGTMHENIRPLFFIHVKNRLLYRFLSFKIKPGNVAATLEALQKKWSQLMPGAPFEYRFLDDTLAGLYQNELRLKKASQTATVISIVIVLLGVMGQVSLNINSRTKEIGIRKVLGASVQQVLALFMKEFTRIMFIANIIAWPFVYLIMNNWLSDYAYRIKIGWTPFAVTSSVLLLAVLLLISLQALSTVKANPVQSLRTE